MPEVNEILLQFARCFKSADVSSVKHSYTLKTDTMPTQFLAKTLALIDTRCHKVSIKDIAQAANVTEQTLRNIIEGRTKNPGVNTIEAIYMYLTEQQSKA